MYTLAPPTPTSPEPSTPSCEQIMPGNVTGDEQDGKLGTGKAEQGVTPEPLQGEADPSEADREEETGAEGGGT
jgi:hypothetical protein